MNTSPDREREPFIYRCAHCKMGSYQMRAEIVRLHRTQVLNSQGTMVMDFVILTCPNCGETDGHQHDKVADYSRLALNAITTTEVRYPMDTWIPIPGPVDPDA